MAVILFNIYELDKFLRNRIISPRKWEESYFYIFSANTFFSIKEKIVLTFSNK